MKHKMRHTAAAATVISLLLPGCVTSTQATRLQKDLDDVKRQVFQVQQDTAGSRAQIEELSRNLSGGGGTGAGTADLQSSMRSLLDQVQRLSERISGLSQEIQSLKAPGSRGSAQNGTTTGAPTMSLPSSGGGGAADQAFKAAYADYSKGNYELAIMGFGDFLKSSAGHPLAADAQYWIGECLYSSGKYKEAASAMDRVVERYPASEKVPAALLKKGYSQIEAGQTSAAVATLQSLMEKHPQSDEARLAGERLRQLGLRAR